MAANYYVLLGDVVLSRDIAHREEFQRCLLNACKKASEHYGATLQTEIKLLKGADEFGAVLKSWQDVFGIINLILDEVHPQQIRFSLVRDLIDVGEDTDDVAKMDGPAFHRASAVIHELKQNGLLFHMVTGDTLTDISLSTQVSMLLLLRQRWTAKHHRVVMAYRKNETQQQIAGEMMVTQQEVSRLSRQISWKQYRIVEEHIYEQFTLLGSGDDRPWTA